MMLSPKGWQDLGGEVLSKGVKTGHCSPREPSLICMVSLTWIILSDPTHSSAHKGSSNVASRRQHGHCSMVWNARIEYRAALAESSMVWSLHSSTPCLVQTALLSGASRNRRASEINQLLIKVLGERVTTTRFWPMNHGQTHVFLVVLTNKDV